MIELTDVNTENRVYIRKDAVVAVSEYTSYTLVYTMAANFKVKEDPSRVVELFEIDQ